MTTAIDEERLGWTEDEYARGDTLLDFSGRMFLAATCIILAYGDHINLIWIGDVQGGKEVWHGSLDGSLG